MRCPECAAEVSDLRAFCPECGKLIPRSRRDREDPSLAPDMRPDGDPKQNRRKIIFAGVGILFAITLVSKASWFGGVIHIDTDRHRGPVSVSAEEVYDAYRADAHDAARRFRGREMIVTGEFVRIVPDGQGNPDLRLHTSNPDEPLGADLIPMSYDAAAHLRPGQKVTVSCQRITRTGDEHWLQNCAIQTPTTTSGPTPPAPPPPPSPPDGNQG